MVKPRVTIRSLMILSALMAAVLAWSTAGARSAAYRKKSRDHASDAMEWKLSAALSEQGIMTIEETADGGESLHFKFDGPRTRPADPEAAALFDRRCAENAGKCRVMARYHDGMRRKWDEAGFFPWFAVEPDPDPPLRIEDFGDREPVP